MYAPGRSGSIYVGGGSPGHHSRPRPRTAGVGTRRAFFSLDTRVKRRVAGEGDRAATRSGRASDASRFGQVSRPMPPVSDRSTVGY